MTFRARVRQRVRERLARARIYEVNGHHLASAGGRPICDVADGYSIVRRDITFLLGVIAFGALRDVRSESHGVNPI